MFGEAEGLGEPGPRARGHVAPRRVRLLQHLQLSIRERCPHLLHLGA